MKQQKINHPAVWTCIIANQLISIIWYSPLLFANRWMNYLGKSFEDFNGESISGLIFSIIGAITFNYFLAGLFKKLQVDSIINGAYIGLVLGICCFSLETFTQDGFSLRPIGLSFINSGSILLNFCISGSILAGWRKYKQ